MTPQIRGLLAMVSACVIWGLSSLYYKLLVDVPTLEVLAHRTVWSLVAFLGLLAWQGRVRGLSVCLGSGRTLRVTALAAALVSVNWCGFIFAVQSGRAMEASLGYYIFPLVAVALGVLVERDRLRRLQWLAVALATVAVCTLTLGLGVFPAISVLLATTFGLYGLLKRRQPADALTSVTAEVVLLAPVGLAWLAGVHLAGWGQGAGAQAAVFGRDAGLSALLAFSGVLTGLPLILFSYASQRLTLPTVGLIQYLNPTLQFLIATLVFLEPFTPWHALAFPMIWTALALYSWDGWSAARRRAMASSASPASETRSSSDAGASSSATTWRSSDTSGSQ